jgi:hypothetical protein
MEESGRALIFTTGYCSPDKPPERRLRIRDPREARLRPSGRAWPRWKRGRDDSQPPWRPRRAEDRREIPEAVAPAPELVGSRLELAKADVVQCREGGV